MARHDTEFAGSIPQLYDQYLGPLLFQPYADELARRAAELRPRRILETASGTGIVTQALARACPDAEIVATDLNQGMLDVAAARVGSDKVSFVAADAQDLAFEDGSFDLVVCQFGIMFMPDKVKANSEAHRVLRPEGRYLLATWDRLDRNPVTQTSASAVADLFPEGAADFMRRAPFSYADVGQIEQDLLSAGFADIELETVTLRGRLPSARDAAVGLCQGTPMRMAIEEHGADALERATEAAAAALTRFEGPDGLDAPMAAHIVTAIA
jgi:ubiquinone/menaquinone biosynthesis C-methylase UbiE